MPSVCDPWGPLPTAEQVEKVSQAVGYSYEAGEFPADMDEYTAAFLDGDGGLLKALAFLKRAVCLLPTGS